MPPTHTIIRFPTYRECQEWTNSAVVTFGDAGFDDRPERKPTGNTRGRIGHRSCPKGGVTEFGITNRRSWNLERKARATDDASIESINEAEHMVRRIRLLMASVDNGLDAKLSPNQPKSASKNGDAFSANSWAYGKIRCDHEGTERRSQDESISRWP